MKTLVKPDAPLKKTTVSRHKFYFANKPLGLSAKSNNAKLSDIRFAQKKGFLLPGNPNVPVMATLKLLRLNVHESEIPDALTYASIRIRSSHDHFPGYNYGTFATTEDNAFVFAKLRYGPKNMEKALIDGELVYKRVGGLSREKAILTSLDSHGYEVPKVFGYTPAFPEGSEPNESDTLETLFIEAIPPEVGSTLPSEYWNEDTALIAATKIKSFNKPASEIELFANEDRSITIETLLKRAELTSDDYKQRLADTLNSYKYLMKPIVVHGDTWLNNIIVKYDNSDVMFVDWELAGPGYRGQDAGRTLWGLTLDTNWDFVGVNPAAESFIRTWCTSSEETDNLRFGLMLESLRWIADRQDSLLQLTDEEVMSVKDEITKIKQHALSIIQSLDNLTA